MRQQLAQAVQALSRIEAAQPGLPAFHAVAPPLGGPPPMWAVDGSSAVVADTGAAWVVAYRAAAVLWPGPRLAEPEILLAAASPDDAHDAVAAAWPTLPDGAGVGEPPRPRDAEGFAEAMRTAAEARATLAAVSAASAASAAPEGHARMVAVDGALSGQPRAAQAVSDALAAAARDAGVRLVGVAKRSRVQYQGVPACAYLARHGPAGAWWCDVGSAVVARLHPAAKHAFRIDGAGAAEVALLAAHAGDAVYTGLPYPLALAHNLVAIPQAVARQLGDDLRDEAGRRGLGHLVADFHAVLDRSLAR